MIIPCFNLSQDETTITINIRAPYCKLQNLETDVEKQTFIFSCNPYYLRLYLPGQIIENENSSSTFDADDGEFTLKYDKVNAGEHFPDLQFITKFISPKVDIEDSNRKIEVLDLQNEFSRDNFANAGTVQFGFAMRGGYNFKNVCKEFKDLFLINPYKVQLKKRSGLKKHMEEKKFDYQHYLADTIDNEQILELLKLEVPWKTLTRNDLKFTTSELNFLKDLHNIKYNLTEKQITYCHNSLVEILYAYCYDYRTTYFEHTCASNWTISRISSSLCCFDSFTKPKEALVCAIRRCLIYPLYREFNLCQQILVDLKLLLALGEQFIIKCLIDIYNIFLKGESGYYILNNLFIKDYIVYIMKWNKNEWLKVVNDINNVTITKDDLGLNLIIIENTATSDDTLSTTLINLSIDSKNVLDSDDDTSFSSFTGSSTSGSDSPSEDTEQ